MVCKILVLYYSQTGSTAKLAELIARGINGVDNCEAVIRTVPKLSDASKTHDIPYVSNQEFASCDGLALGSPTRFGNMAAHLKYFLDSTSHEWMHGSLINKPACVFTSTNSMHGGQESTLLSMMLPLIHHGMLIIGTPYSEESLISTTSGGTPYGVSHYAGIDGSNPITNQEKNLAIAQGKRLAEIALKLK